MKIEVNKEKLYSTYGSELTGALHQIADVICSESLLKGEKVLLIADILENHKFISEQNK